MRRYRIACSAGALLAGCAPPPMPQPAEPPPVVPAVTSTASAASARAPAAPSAAPCPARDAAPPVGGPWVTFNAPAYDGQDGPFNGPSWAFAAPKLPAVSPDGQRVLVAKHDGSLGEVPGMNLVVQRVTDGKVLSSTALLDAAAFARAHGDSPDLAGRRRNFDALREVVSAHVGRLNEALGKEGWTSLVACQIDIDAGATYPACSMKDQQIQCGSAVRMVYREPQLDVTVRGRVTHLRDPRRVVRPASVPGNREARYPIRGCVGAAFLEPVRGLALLLLQYECQGGGDGCYVPDRWEIVRLPAAPGPEPSPKGDGGSCPKGMIAIAGGTLTMGSTDGEPSERPPHPVSVSAFCLDATEVTVADYHACLKAGRCFSPKASRLIGPGAMTTETPDDSGCNDGVRGREGHPMNCVPWSFAREYCDAQGKRLPSEEEWEYAARGSELRSFPWGAAPPGPGVCWKRARGEGTCAAGASAADQSPLGVLDLAGNVSEWTMTPYASYDGCWSESGAVAIRGGSFSAASAPDLRGARRESTARTTRGPQIGFRCAKSR